MKNRTILAIDQATITSGYSIYKNGKIKKNDVIKCSEKELGRRYSQFFKRLNDVIDKYQVTEIVAEDVFKGEQKGYIRLSELRGVLLLAAASKKIPVVFIAPSTHKENLTGNRYANKLETMQTLKELGYDFKDDNAADSISIMITYLNNRNFPVIHPNQ